MARGETITVVRPPARGRFGDPAAGTPQRFDVPGTLFAPGPSQELGAGAGANQVDTDGTVYPPPTILTIVPGGPKPTDQIEVRGDLYGIVGDPQNWGARRRLVILLRKVTG